MKASTLEGCRCGTEVLPTAFHQCRPIDRHSARSLITFQLCKERAVRIRATLRYQVSPKEYASLVNTLYLLHFSKPAPLPCLMIKISVNCLFTNSRTVRPMAQGLSEPMSATTLHNLDKSIPCCLLYSSRVVHCCGVYAISGILAVGGCPCRSARRVCDSAPTNRTSGEQKRKTSTRERTGNQKQRHTHCSKNRPVTGGLVHCKRFLSVNDFPKQETVPKNLHSGAT